MSQEILTSEPRSLIIPRVRQTVAPVVVWGTWAIMLVAGLAYVARYGSNVPSWDGWDMVPTIIGVQPVTASWLWSQHNEHRVPIPRLVMLGLYRLAGFDLRVAQSFNVLVTAALALGFILVARKRRGWTSPWDAFFPLLLLNLGQGLNFIWAWQVEFFTSTVLAGLGLVIVVRAGDRPILSSGLGAGVLLILLVLCGAHGMVLVPALALWPGAVALRRRNSPDERDRRGSLLLLGLTALAVLTAALYMVGYEPVPGHPTRPRLLKILKTAVQFIAMGYGSAVLPWWPYPDLLVVGLMLASVATLVLALVNRPAEHLRALGLLAFLVAMGCLALALGMGRHKSDPRYITLSVPAMACVYFIWDIYGPPRLNRIVRMLLCIATLLALWPNTRDGLEYATWLRGRLGSFERDMVGGMPPYRLIQRYYPDLHIHQDMLIDYMPLLRRAGVGAFRSLRDDPPFRKVPVLIEPVEWAQATWDPATKIAHLTGQSPSVVFDLGEDRYVDGIRIKYRHSNPSGTAPCVTLYWKRGDQEHFSEQQSYRNYPTGDRANWEKGTWLRLDDPETTMTVWLCDTVMQINLAPDIRPGTFHFVELVLLLRDAE
jgi:hypothetical protein